jgi:hypothetical protein
LQKLIIIIFLFVPGILFAQSSNLRTKYISVTNDTTIIDSLSIIPGSVVIKDEDNNILPDSLYIIDYGKSCLINLKHGVKNYYFIEYKVYPIYFSKKFYQKDYNTVNKGIKIETKQRKYSGEKNVNNFFDEGIVRSGNISRGISIGNNQDVIVNSNLNLQLNGYLNNNLRLSAVISDQNIPIQPDGYSQKIQEFDKIFINISDENNSVTAGDFDLFNNYGYFGKFSKKLQGLSYTTSNNISQKGNKKLSNEISLAIAKGKYRRQKILAIEGIQGPYRLSGENDELYIIILAGSEKVYINGQLQKRGEDNDYVIDYNNAEITFTSKNIITKDKRIIVEFEYSDKNYSRYLIYNSNVYKTNNRIIKLSVYQEQDLKNQPILQSLNETQKMLLKQSGDNKIYIQNVDSTGFTYDAIRYKKITDNINGTAIYQYSTNPDSAIYKVIFSYVGENNGNYIIAKNVANGRIYEYIAPENGLKKGSYEPITQIVAPSTKRLINFITENSISGSMSLFTEISLSYNDKNNFSDIDDKDNQGIAAIIKINKIIIDKDSGKNALISKIKWEYISKNYSSIEHLRTIEFERDWNITQNMGYGSHLIEASLSYRYFDKINSAYNFEFLKDIKGITGNRNNLVSEINKKGYRFLYNGSYTNTYNTGYNTTFYRHKALFSKKINKTTIGIKSDFENNLWKETKSDSLISNSYMYNETELYQISGDSSKNYFYSGYKTRTDKLPENNKLIKTSFNNDLYIGFIISTLKNNRIGINSTYRKVKYFGNFRSNNNDDEHLLVRLEHALNLKKNFFSTSTFYEFGTGMELVKDYSYIKVAKGQGYFKWNDYNNNSIAELDEFEKASFSDEADYIKVFFPSGSYEKVYSNQFNQIINIIPARILKNKSILSKFSNQFAYKISQKNKNKTINAYIPLPYSVKNENLVNIYMSLRNNLSYILSKYNFSANYIIQKSINKNLLANGFDLKQNTSQNIELNKSIAKNFMLHNYTAFTNNEYESELLTKKNYKIKNQSNKTTIDFPVFSGSQINFTYEIAFMKNNNGEERLKRNNLEIGLKVAKGSLSNIDFSINYIQINFNSTENSSIAYEMLGGYKQGKNFVWSILYKQTVFGNLEISVGYNGRYIDKKFIHNAEFQARALF